MSDALHPTPDAAFARGQLLQSQHRLPDAVACYKQALELDAHHTPSFIMLALCWMQDDDTAPKSIDAARRAVALEPENAFARSVFALALNANAKDGQTGAIKEALQQAEEAVGLDPDSDFSHAVLSRLHLRLRDYPKAEAAARAALALDTENTMAAEVLSAALLLQKKDGDNKHLINYQLQRNAEDDSAHTSAGWQAVMEGDHKKANEHFMEALRLNPMNEAARMGLIESFRARSWVYRTNIRFCHWMNQFTEGRQNVIMIGGFIGYKVLSGYLKTVAPFWANVVIGAWLVFALWSHLARGFSTFFVAMDRFARQALKPREYWEGVVVGWLIFLSLTALVLGYVYGEASSGFVALTCILAAVANAAAFTNDHHLGRHVYNIAASISGLGAVYSGIAIFAHLDLPYADLAGLGALIIGIVITWLRPFRVLYA
ncbi:MAG: tetratricopeptide repeat protein [Prosthecobacter sp.]|uniref:tetratricopeptide repeat protein n=1 Tax=Prosthecobacter sp. TaxID=1965333 RepID=UPI0039042BB6